jgi:hypothetical protein
MQIPSFQRPFFDCFRGVDSTERRERNEPFMEMLGAILQKHVSIVSVSGKLLFPQADQ